MTSNLKNLNSKSDLNTIHIFLLKNLIKEVECFLKKHRNAIAILLCFFLIFGINTTATAQTTQIYPQAAAVVEETNLIQKMLDKLQQIINLMAKTGSITVKCID